MIPGCRYSRVGKQRYSGNGKTLIANFAYRTLTYQGYNKDTIYYLSHDTDLDLDGNGVLDDVDADAANANLQNAITTWAAAEDTEDLFIYMVDHGGDGTFRMRGDQLLQAKDLDIWLDTLQQTMTGQVVLVYDACRSGSFLSHLTPPDGATRVLATSAASDQESIFAVQGRISFSYIFWSEMFNGNPFYNSFVRAAQSVGMTYSQIPQIECNGNGTGNEIDDKSFAQNVHVGTETLSAGDIPYISGLSSEQTLAGETSAQISITSVTDADGISRVWAIITPPDFDPGSPDTPVTDLPIVDFTSTTGDGYAATYDGFNVQGTYNIAVYATDQKGVMGIPAQTTVIQTKAPKGDLNGDNDVDLTDAVIALKILVGLDVSGELRSNYSDSGADVDGNGVAGFSELLYILRDVANN